MSEPPVWDEFTNLPPPEEADDANHCEECGQWLEDPDRLGPTPGCGTCMADHLGSMGDDFDA